MLSGEKNKILIVLLISISMQWPAVHAMEIAEESAIGSLTRGVEEAGGAEAAELLEGATKDILGSGTEGLEKLPQETQEVLQKSMQKELTDVAAQFKAGTLTKDQLQAETRDIVTKARGDFETDLKTRVQKSEGLTVDAKDVVANVPGIENVLGDVDKITSLPKSEVKPAGVEPTQPVKVDTLENQSEIAGNKAVAKEGEAIDATLSGDSAKIEKTAQDAAQAETDAATKEAQYKTDVDTKVTQATTSADQAKSAATSTATEGDATKISETESDVEKTTKDLADKEEAQNLQKRKSSKQKYEKAKNKYDELKKARKENAKEFKEGKITKEEFDKNDADYSNKIDAAREKLSDATKEYIEKGSWKDVDRLKVWGKKKVVEGTISKIKSLAEFAVSGVANWAFFTVPSMVVEAFERHVQREALLDTMRSSHNFGGIVMKIPSDFINSEDPQNSRFIYIGLDDPKQKITRDLIPYANYYVSISEYGDLAKSAIAGDPTFPDKMVHLNTGFVFLNDGQPNNPEAPSLQLLNPLEPTEKGAIERPITLQDALQHIASLASGQTIEEVQDYFDQTSAGYKGSTAIADLMRSKENELPSILKNLVNALQAGGPFGPFQLHGISMLDQNQLTLLGKQIIPLEKNNETLFPIASGIYIYQTQDTEFAKMMSSQIKKGTPEEQILHESLYDYVVIIDNPNNPTKLLPLQVPSIKDKQPAYYPNPDAQYMISLVDPEIQVVDENQQVTSHSVVYSRDGTVYSGQGRPLTEIEGLIPKGGGDWLSQITAMRDYFRQHILYGPFKIGAQTLDVLDKTLIDAPNQLPIYQVPGFLEDGSDDYVISIIKPVPPLLPLPSLLPRRIYIESDTTQQAKQLFVSLVTSRFYDSSMAPLIVRDPKTGLPTAGVNFYIVKNPDGSQKVTTTPQTGIAPAGKAQPYNVFVDEAFNPNNPAGGIIPTGQQWALKNMKVFDRAAGAQPTLISVADFFQKYPDDVKDLQAAIEKSYDAWKINNDNKYPIDVDRQKGPFTWIEGVQPIVLLASSAEDIKANVYVYTSPSYPDQFLVLSNSEAVSGTVPFDASSPQRYAISLSSGQIYDRQNGGVSVGTSPDFNNLLVQAQSTRKFPATLLSKIQESQQVAINRMRQYLYGPDVVFGKFQFYINAQDFSHGQFIYADVTNLGNPLNADGSENNAVVSKVNDYFVVIARTPKKDASGTIIPNEYDYDFGVELGLPVAPGTELSVASLVSGAAFSRTGYEGSYNQFAGIKEEGVDITATTPEKFAQNVLDVIAKKSGTSVRLAPTITTLTAAAWQEKLKEIKEIEQEEQVEAQLFQPLPDNILQNILSAPAAVMNPNVPRYFSLKSSGGKYYAVTPAPEKEGDPAQTIIDYNYNPTGLSKDTGMGMVWQVVTKDGATLAEPKLLLRPIGPDDSPKPGWALQVARAYAGVNVDPKTGAQSLVLGISIPALPMMIKKGTVLTPALMETPLTQSITVQGTGQFTMAPGVTQATGATLQLKVYYNMLTNTYFMSVTRPDKSSYYVDLQSGFCYDWDGRSELAVAHISQTPVYQNKKGENLLVGIDEYNTLKLVFNNPYLGQGYQPYTLSSTHFPEGGIIFGKVKAQQTVVDLGNLQGTLYNLTNDYDLSEIQAGYIFKDAAGNQLPSGATAAQPSYALWKFDSNINSLYYIDQYTPVKDLYYSLLIYQQTRQPGSAITSGSYVDSDNFHNFLVTIDDTTGQMTLELGDDLSDKTKIVSLMNIVGIIFDGNKTFKSLYYKNQIIPLTAAGGQGMQRTYNGSYQDIGADKKPVTKPVVVATTMYTFPNTNAQAMLISITDGGKTYDYMYDFKILNVDPLIDKDKSSVEFDLYQALRSWQWPSKGTGLVQSQFIPNVALQSKPASAQSPMTVPNSPTNTFASTALVGSLGLLSPAPAVKCPPSGAATCVQDQLTTYLAQIKMITNSNLFIPYLVKNKPITSFVYKLGNDWDVGKSYYPTLPGSSKSYLNGWYVDLSNGILYMPTINPARMPAGFALLPSQLTELLDTINISVQFDQDGYPSGLQFKGAVPPAAPAK